MADLTTDYLIIGSGAMGMAFADVMLTETDASIVIVDKYHQPGGHWNVAYPHVRLHQPSAFYGVNSKALGSNAIDTTGFNKGLYELATNSEVVGYFDQVMQQQFVASGRVSYFPSCEYLGDGRFKSLVSGKETQVEAHTVVDATYMNVTVPAMRPPQFPVADGITCAPPNSLSRLNGQYERYLVIGAGKTGMDACLFLLKNEVDPTKIAWIMPRDSWMLDRANIQPGALFAESIGKSFAQQAADIAQASDIDDLFARVEASGNLIRLDPNQKPTMYRCATVTTSELDALRTIENVIRLGRVKAVTDTEVILDEGRLPTDERTLHIDCTADGLERRPAEPVFAPGTITLQSVRTCQQVFSAAFIAHIEASYEDEVLKNELCTPVPHPDTDLDYLRTNLANNSNAARWSQDPDLSAWLKQSRLDGFTQADAPEPDMSDPNVQQQFSELAELNKAAQANLTRLLNELD